LVEWLSKKGYRLIREGKMPLEGWHEPDLFVLRDLTLEKVVEVVVLDAYEGDERSVKEKIRKVKEYYDPPEIVVFEPVGYLDRERLPRMKDFYRAAIGFEPHSYRDVEEFYTEKWKKEGLSVLFWNEEDLKD